MDYRHPFPRCLYDAGATIDLLERLQPEQADYRSAYKVDVDKILQSRAYARYFDKTQVVYLVHQDHVTRRALHVQLVSSFSRGIAHVLGLNCDLVEAISLGHDTGHCPFGHEGEGYLSELCQEYGEGPFTHSAQSCRLLSVIEPLNLCLAVYDGFLCHDGGTRDCHLRPALGKDWRQHHEEVRLKQREPETNLMPMTLEGCLVKICDTVSYLSRDIEDAIKIGIIERSQVPTTDLGNTNESILRRFAKDLIENSRASDQIAFSPETLEALQTLRRFNYETFYFHPKLKVESQKIKLSYRILFDYLVKDFNDKHTKSYLWTHFAHNKPKAYLDNTTPTRLVIDFIAGMTDGYFVRTVRRLLVPEQIDVSC